MRRLRDRDQVDGRVGEITGFGAGDAILDIGVRNRLRDLRRARVGGDHMTYVASDSDRRLAVARRYIPGDVSRRRERSQIRVQVVRVSRSDGDVRSGDAREMVLERIRRAQSPVAGAAAPKTWPRRSRPNHAAMAPPTNTVAAVSAIEFAYEVRSANTASMYVT